VRVLVLSVHGREIYVNQVIKSGSHGYLLKDSAGVDLLRAVTALSAAKSFFSPSVTRIMRGEQARRRADRDVIDRYDVLSQREREVFQRVAEGPSSKEFPGFCASALGLSKPPCAHHGEAGCAQRRSKSRFMPMRRGIISWPVVA
jgi:DNA-binding NarL/FixJ family response regulator